MQQIWSIVVAFDWRPFWISLKTAVVATIICFFLGLWAANAVSRMKSRWRALIDGVLTLSMVLPPTVVGFFLLLLFSLRRPVGSFLYYQLGIKVVQTWLGCIIAATVISFPLMYRNTRSAIDLVDHNLVYAAQTLGMSKRKIFWRVIFPSATPGIVSGTVLTFARALGEYGATSMLAGNIAGKTGTISQRIANVIKDGDYLTAGIWSIIMLAFSLVVMVATSMLSLRRRRR